jgi:hypothetical protein
VWYARPPDLRQAVLLAGLQQRRVHDIVVGPGAPELQARLAGHAVAQRAHWLARDREARHMEEAQLRRLFAGRFADDVHGAGTLHLVSIENRIALPVERVVVAPDAHVVAARAGMEVQPVDRRRNADGLVFVLLEVEEDVVADDVAVVVDGDELLRHVDRKFRDAVDGELADHFQRVGTFDVEIRHVVRLIEQDRGAAPSLLLVAPIRELLHHARDDGGRRLRFPQKLHRAAGLLNRLLEIPHHSALTPIFSRCGAVHAVTSRGRAANSTS